MNSCTNLCVVCRVLRPPGGGSSNLFGGYEEDTSASRRPNKMSSSIFAPPEETRGGPRRSNPPGERAADTLTLSEWKSPHCDLVLCVRDSLCLPLCKQGHFAFVIVSPKATSKPLLQSLTSQLTLWGHTQTELNLCQYFVWPSFALIYSL